MTTIEKTLATINVADLKKYLPTLKRFKESTAYLQVDYSGASITIYNQSISTQVSLKIRGSSEEPYYRTISIKTLESAAKSCGLISFNEDEILTPRSQFSYSGTDSIESLNPLTITGQPEQYNLDTKALKIVSEFASKDHLRYILNTVYFDGNKLVATDGKRLAIREIDEMPKFLMGYQAAKIISCLKTALVSFSDAVCRVISDDLTILTKAVEGNFPNYQNVLPNEPYDTGWDLALREVAVELSEFLRGFDDSVLIKLNDLIKIESSNGQFVPGSSIIGLPCQDVSLNSTLLSSLIKAGVDYLQFKDAFSPVIGTGDRLTTLLMPLRQS